MISQRVLKMKKSAIHEMTRLSKQFEDVAFLSWAKPTSGTPEHIRQGAISAIQKGITDGYSPTDGIEELRKEIVVKLHRDNNIKADFLGYRNRTTNTGQLMHKLLITISSIFLSLFIASYASAVTTYKWMDEDGNMVYSQHPPAEGISYEKIQTRSPSRSSAETKSKTSSARNSILEDKARKDKKDIVSKELSKNEETRKKNCEIAKERMAFFQIQRRYRDQEGNIKSLSDEERKEKLEQAKSEVKEFCD